MLVQTWPATVITLLSDKHGVLHVLKIIFLWKDCRIYSLRTEQSKKASPYVRGYRRLIGFFSVLTSLCMLFVSEVIK
jgi:hypothetical protein